MAARHIPLDWPFRIAKLCVSAACWREICLLFAGYRPRERIELVSQKRHIRQDDRFPSAFWQFRSHVLWHRDNGVLVSAFERTADKLCPKTNPIFVESFLEKRISSAVVFCPSHRMMFSQTLPMGSLRPMRRISKRPHLPTVARRDQTAKNTLLHSLRRMTLKNAISFVVAVCCFPLASLADPATECGGSSQVEIGACVSDTLLRVDTSVDIYLGLAMRAAIELDLATGRTRAVPALESAQAAWSAYRDAQCEYVGSTFGGGSGTGIAVNSCRILLGRDRKEELVRYLQ